MNKDFKISVVLPASNEEKNIPLMLERLIPVLQEYPDYEVIFVNDGSKDNTLNVLREMHQKDSKVNYISFSRNFGHQNALRAGYAHATGDCIVCLDADLQQPPEMIRDMVQKWQEGFEVVYTIREESENASFFKKLTSNFFYSLINSLSNTHIEKGAADFRLIDRKVLDALNQYGEYHIFYRGLIASMGFKQTSLSYVAAPRKFGKTNYSFKKMFNLALNGITGFSTLPLHLSTIFGLVVAGLSFVYALYAVVIQIFGGYTVPGWSSILFGIFFLGGIQLIMIGVLGEYIGKLFFEVKNRPSFIISESTVKHD